MATPSQPPEHVTALPLERARSSPEFAAAGLRESTASTTVRVMLGSLPLMRLVIVRATIIVAVGGNLLAIVIGQDLWPFSAYQMYSGLQRDNTSAVRAYGVSSVDGSEFPLPNGTEPGGARLRNLVGRISNGEDGMTVDGVAGSLACVYERRLARGGGGPRPIAKVRVYRLRWRLDASLANRHHPERELLGEGACR